MIKKIFSIALVLIMAMSLFTISASAEGVDSTYNVSENNKYRLATHNGYFEIDYGTLVGYGYIIEGYEVYATQACLSYVYVDSGGKVSCSPNGVDGQFGPNTYNALYNFQVHYNLTYKDGIAGDETFAKFERLI